MSSLPVFLRPSTKFTEIDLTQRADVIAGNRQAVVGEFERGPLDAVYTSGLISDYKRQFGQKANPQISFAYDTVEATMTQTDTVLIKRTVNNAYYAGATVFVDTVGSRIRVDPFPTKWTNLSHKSGLTSFLLISFSADLEAADTIDLDITDGETVTPITQVTYATSHDATLASLATAIQNGLNTFGVGASVKVVPEVTGNSKLVIVRIPSTFQVELTGLTTTGSKATLVEDARLFDTYAENPGGWANDYGILLSNIDAGIRERYILQIAGPLITGNSISVDVNGTTVTTPFDTDSDTTLAAFATALEGTDVVNSATVVTVPGAADNDRAIQIVVGKPGIDVVTLTNPVVTLGATQVAVSVTKTLTGAPADNSFRLQVFNRSNVNRPEETFTVALPKQLDAMGYAQNIEQVVNSASTKSVNIRIAQSTESLSSLTMYDASMTPLEVPTLISWLDGGDNGLACTSAQIRDGWNSLDDRVQYPVDVLLNAGYTDVAVQKTMVALAEKRGDCIAILDAPSDKQDAQTLRDYRLFELNIDSNYGAMYTPDVEIEDINTGERRFIPPSGPIGATYSYSDRLTNAVGAPAGLNRGKVTLAVGLRHYYTASQQELIYPVGLNFIANRPGTGPVVMAEETLQVKKSVLSSVHARRIVNRIKTSLVDGLDYTLFEPNTEYTRFQARQVGETLLRPMTAGDGTGGLYSYRIKCDNDNNTPDVIDADQLAYAVYLKITRVIKGIYVIGYLTRTGASFEELIEQAA